MQSMAEYYENEFSGTEISEGYVQEFADWLESIQFVDKNGKFAPPTIFTPASTIKGRIIMGKEN